MPWRKASPMDQRTQFIADYLRDSLAITEPCEIRGVPQDRLQVDRALPPRPFKLRSAHPIAVRAPLEDATIPLFSGRRPTAQAPVWKGASSLG